MVNIVVFGGVRITVDGADRTPPGQIPSRLLAALTSSAPLAVSVSDLIEAGWGSDPPATVESALRTHLTVLRKALDGGIESTSRAYRLTDPASIDLVTYEELVATARATPDDQIRFDVLTAALNLWTGPPWGNVAEFTGLSRRALTLAERHRNVEDEWAALAADRSSGGANVDRLWALATDEPLRERRWVNLVRSLHAAGLTADALRAYEIARRTLADELGVRPGAQLRSAHDALFGQRPSGAATTTRARTVPSGPIVGRATELRHVEDRLAEGQVVTLVGIGGMGKSRVAEELVDARVRRGERAWMMLAPPAALSHRLNREIAAQIAIAAPTELDAADALVARLVDVDLLVIDGADGCIDGVVALLEAIRQRRPNCRIVVTARLPLGFGGELSIPIGSLPLPGLGESWRGTAVELLARARGVNPLDSPDLLDELIEDSRTAGGVPLLLELAGHSGPSLTGFGSDADRIVRTALELVDSLEPSTRQLARAMAVLPGGLDNGLACRVISSTPSDVDRRLRYLNWLGIARSMTLGRASVQVMPDPIRDAIVGELDQRVMAEVRELLVDHLLDIGSAIRPRLGDPLDRSGFARLDGVEINLRSVLDAQDPRWLEVAAGAADYLGCRGYSGEAIAWMTDALTDSEPLVRASAALTAARIGRLGGNVVALVEPLIEASAVFREAGEADGFVFASVFAALGRLFQQRIDDARELLNAARCSDPQCTALSLEVINLTEAFITLALGDTETAAAEIEALAERVESVDLVVASLARYLLVAAAQGDPARAHRYIPDALRVADSIGDAPMAAAVRLVDASIMGSTPAAVGPLRDAAVSLDAAGMPERAAVARLQAGSILLEVGSAPEGRLELLDAVGPLERLGSASALVAIALLAGSVLVDDSELAMDLAHACRARQSSHRNGYAGLELVQLRVDQLLADIPFGPGRTDPDLRHLLDRISVGDSMKLLE